MTLVILDFAAADGAYSATYRRQRQRPHLESIWTSPTLPAHRRRCRHHRHVLLAQRRVAGSVGELGYNLRFGYAHVLDTSINMAMQPFKMLVGDFVNENKRSGIFDTIFLVQCRQRCRLCMPHNTGNVYVQYRCRRRGTGYGYLVILYRRGSTAALRGIHICQGQRDAAGPICCLPWHRPCEGSSR